MSKKIFISGYFSLHGIMDILAEEDVQFYTFYETDYENAECLAWKRESSYSKDEERLMYDILGNLVVGGQDLAMHAYTRNFMANWLIGSFRNAQIAVEQLETVGDFDAIIVHNDHDPVYGSVAAWGKQRGIPTFCFYNGFSSLLHPVVGGMNDYRFGHHYGLNGDIVLEYLKKRVSSTFKGRLTGCAAWDVYYKSEAERVPNTYLYNPGVNTDDTEMDGNIFVVSTAVHPWTSMLRPVSIDTSFYRGFAKFQREVNPNAKLWITTRPFNMFGDIHTEIATRSGVQDVHTYTSDDRPFRQLIKECEYFVSGISTTIQEGILTRTPTGFLCGKTPAEDFFKGRECYIESTISEDSVVRMLEVMGEDKESLIETCDARAYYYNYMDDGKASERSVEYILDVVEGRQ